MQRLRYLIGVLTLAATVAAGWFLVRLLGDEDRSGLFSLRIEFRDVRGLKDGADVKYRGVRAGSVRAVELSGDGERGLVTVLLDTGIESLARQSSRFWIVVPRFGGLAGGATGLDTLVRDAYIAFLTPDLTGPKLAPGSLIAGLERPFETRGEESLDPVRRGDLRMTLLVPENHGLKLGAEVRFRGIVTGDVRSIELAEDGSHVRIGLLIRQRYRQTVTDRSDFWIARPRLSGALLSGLAIQDLSAILAPFVGYYTEPGRGVPVPDGHRIAAATRRPEVGNELPEDAIVRPAPPSTPADGDARPIRLVQVLYEAVEEDWLSADDHVSRKGTGVLFTDRGGRPVVATARSMCDASYFMGDTLGTDPDIKAESIRIAIPGGSVLRANRPWVDPDGHDLAILVLEGAPPDLPVTGADRFSFDDAGAGADGGTDRGRAMLLDHADPEADPEAEPIELGDIGSLPIDERRGDVLVRDERVFGIVGQRSGSDASPVPVSLARLPPELRPGS